MVTIDIENKTKINLIWIRKELKSWFVYMQQMKISMMKPNTSWKYVYFGSKASVRKVIIAHFCMKILKKNSRFVNILKNKGNVLKVNNVCIDIHITLKKLITRFKILVWMDNLMSVNYVLILREVSAIKEYNASFINLI